MRWCLALTIVDARLFFKKPILDFIIVYNGWRNDSEIGNRLFISTSSVRETRQRAKKLGACRCVIAIRSPWHSSLHSSTLAAVVVRVVCPDGQERHSNEPETGCNGYNNDEECIFWCTMILLHRVEISYYRQDCSHNRKQRDWKHNMSKNLKIADWLTW